VLTGKEHAARANFLMKEDAAIATDGRFFFWTMNV
jgi:hypothetical protein